MNSTVLTTLDQLAAVLFRPPLDAGRLWWGVPHAELAGAFEDGFAAAGWQIADRAFCVGTGGTELLAVWGLTPPEGRGEPRPPLGQGFAFATRVSYRRRRSFRVYAGVSDLAAGCVVWLERLLLGGRHRPPLRQRTLPQHVRRCLTWFRARCLIAGRAVAELRGKHLDASRCEHLLLEAGRRRLLPWSRLGRADRTLDRAGKGVTAWRLLTAVADASRLGPPIETIDHVYQFHTLLHREKTHVLL